MRRVVAALVSGALLAAATALTPSPTWAEPRAAQQASLPPAEAGVRASDVAAFETSTDVLRWISTYRSRRDPDRVAAAYRTASRTGALKEPSTAGIYVGFLAGLIGAAPGDADRLIDAVLPIGPSDRWVVVRAIAYSGHPEWKRLLASLAPRIPQYGAMIEGYLGGSSPTLSQLAMPRKLPFWERWRDALFRTDDDAALAPGPAVIDTLWGVYFATGEADPIERIVALLPWSNDHDDLERLIIGSMAKFTLAANAARDPALHALLEAQLSAHKSAEITTILHEVVAAADENDVDRVRQNALTAIDTLQRKDAQAATEPGPASTVWSRIGDGMMSLGCLAATAVGQAAFGARCLVDGTGHTALGYRERRE